MLAFHNLACVRDDRPLFSGLNDEIGPGDWVQIEGANGAGKTSLLRILAGLAPPATLWILDEPLTALDLQGVKALTRQFEQHCATGGMVILTTHQPLPPSACRVRKIALDTAETASCSG
ncbi:hypothetical protein BK025_15115 [Sodalis sp. TME1]|nr:hypothetical protein BK025_15115 [Sodalis sp. TME1]